MPVSFGPKTRLSKSRTHTQMSGLCWEVSRTLPSLKKSPPRQISFSVSSHFRYGGRYLTFTDAADASDHEEAAKAIAAGLIKGHSKEKPGFWLHTSGTGVLCFADSDNDFAGLGRWSDQEYNDLSGVEELTSLPDHAFHRQIDKFVLDVAEKHEDAVKTAIVCPPTIYGELQSFPTETWEFADDGKVGVEGLLLPVVDRLTRWES